MTNLPFISHHLFVAAVASEDRVRLSQTPHETNRPDLAGHARAIPLEVMEHAKGMASAARPLRAVQAASRP